MRWRDGTATEITPPEANVRTRVHEYGGGAWWIHDGIAFYVDDSDQRLRSITPAGDVAVLSPEPATPRALRFADMRVSPDGRWVVSIGEEHAEGTPEPINRVVALSTAADQIIHVVAEGHDFYQSPRFSPDGSQLCWTAWDHPNMPWDDTVLYCAEVTLGDTVEVGPARIVAGGVTAGEAVVQPEWSPDGRLHFGSDRNDRWQIFVEGDDEPVLDVAGEVGYPPWVFGLSRYAFLPSGEIVAARFVDGVEVLDQSPEYTAFNTIRTSGTVDAPVISYGAASWSAEATVIANGEVIRAPRSLGLDPGFLTAPEVIRFPASNNPATEVSALFFAPAHPTTNGPEGERPPLIVLAHGGPTSAARSELKLERRFWTSRGFAVVDVNYRGSSGFGRRYRKALDGHWGIADVQDCVAAAQFLADRGDVDPDRLLIRGGSAGGFTVLSALAFHDTFAAGASSYGVADLTALAEDTHKFESRYLDNLVGPYPEAREIYEQRSPINHLDGFDKPMIVLQGSEDEIVPPAQSRMIVAALEARGVPVVYLEFEGEQHGFRKAETVIAALEAELGFFGSVCGFTPASPLD